MTGPLLTARAVAELLGVSTETVLRWSRRGELPSIRLPGGAVRFHHGEIEAWLAERATPARGVRTTTTDAAQDARYLPGSTDAGANGRELASSLRTTTPQIVAAPEDEE